MTEETTEMPVTTTSLLITAMSTMTETVSTMLTATETVSTASTVDELVHLEDYSETDEDDEFQPGLIPTVDDYTDDYEDLMPELKNETKYNKTVADPGSGQGGPNIFPEILPTKRSGVG